MATEFRVLMGAFALIYLGGSLLPCLPPFVADIVAICLDVAILFLDFIFWRAVVIYLWGLLLAHDQNPTPQTHPAFFIVWRRGPATVAARNALIASILNSAEAAPDFRCAICLADGAEDAEEEPSPVVVRLVCGHYFCRECITAWLADRHNTCPLCRRKLFREPRVGILVYVGVFEG